MVVVAAGMRPNKMSKSVLGEIIAAGADGTCLRRKSDGSRLKDDID